MTAAQVRTLMRLAIGETPHAQGAIDQAEWFIMWMSRAELAHAGQCYAAIVGERDLPPNFGTRHAQTVLARPLQGTARMVRQGEARRILENRRIWREIT